MRKVPNIIKIDFVPEICFLKGETCLNVKEITRCFFRLNVSKNSFPALNASQRILWKKSEEVLQTFVSENRLFSKNLPSVTMDQAADQLKLLIKRVVWTIFASMVIANLEWFQVCKTFHFISFSQLNPLIQYMIISKGIT